MFTPVAYYSTELDLRQSSYAGNDGCGVVITKAILVSALSSSRKDAKDARSAKKRVGVELFPLV